MSDEIELYVGRVAVPGAGLAGWRVFAETVFTEAEFLARPRATAHRDVRRWVDRYYDYPPEPYHYLRATASVVRKRLLIQGYTSDFCRQAWDIARRQTISIWQRHMSDPSSTAAQALAAMEDMTFEAWAAEIQARARQAPTGTLGGRYNPWDVVSLLDGPDDPLVQLALLTEIFPRAPVWMDCFFLADYGSPIRSPYEIAREEDHEAAQYPSGKIIVLTEGRTDSRVIKAALQRLYPEFSGAYQFVDFEEFRLEGGASVLAKMVRILAGAGLQNRLLAIFDNDVAGVEAMGSLRGAKLPQTVRLMTLPSTPLASAYPTIGPNGLTEMNVNGAGAAIELYLGRSALTDDNGRLRPVRWQHWNKPIGRYHGAIDDKDAVIKAFENILAQPGSPAEVRRRLPEMELLLRSIFSAFEGQLRLPG